MVVFYAGANQFTSIKNQIKAKKTPQPTPPPKASGTNYSAIIKRIKFLLSSPNQEPPKPEYESDFPNGKVEVPDLKNPGLPLTLPGILNDLDSIRSDLETIEAELVISSFVMAVEDGMELDPIRNEGVYKWWNEYYWPLKYADIRKMLDYLNSTSKLTFPIIKFHF